MGGFLGIGTPNSVKVDRNNQLGATENLQNVFNYALPQGQGENSAGLVGLNDAQAQFARMANAGRAQTAQTAAPTTNAIQDQADATKRSQASQGTARGGGTAEVNANAGATTTKNIDDVLNKVMMQQKEAGAEGLAQTAGTELSSAANMLGLGTNAINSVMDNAGNSRSTSLKIAQQTDDSQLGELAATLLMGGFNEWANS